MNHQGVRVLSMEALEDLEENWLIIFENEKQRYPLVAATYDKFSTMLMPHLNGSGSRRVSYMWMQRQFAKAFVGAVVVNPTLTVEQFLEFFQMDTQMVDSVWPILSSFHATSVEQMTLAAAAAPPPPPPHLLHSTLTVRMGDLLIKEYIGLSNFFNPVLTKFPCLSSSLSLSSLNHLNQNQKRLTLDELLDLELDIGFLENEQGYGSTQPIVNLTTVLDKTELVEALKYSTIILQLDRHVQELQTILNAGDERTVVKFQWSIPLLELLDQNKIPLSTEFKMAGLTKSLSATLLNTAIKTTKFQQQLNILYCLKTIYTTAKTKFGIQSEGTLEDSRQLYLILKIQHTFSLVLKLAFVNYHYPTHIIGKSRSLQIQYGLAESPAPSMPKRMVRVLSNLPCWRLLYQFPSWTKTVSHGILDTTRKRLAPVPSSLQSSDSSASSMDISEVATDSDVPPPEPQMACQQHQPPLKRSCPWLMAGQSPPATKFALADAKTTNYRPLGPSRAKSISSSHVNNGPDAGNDKLPRDQVGKLLQNLIRLIKDDSFDLSHQHILDLYKDASSKFTAARKVLEM